MAPAERADDERPDPVVSVGEGEGEDVDLEEVVVEERSTTVDGPLGRVDVVGIKVAVGLVSVLTLVLTLVLVRDGGTTEGGTRHLGVLVESRKHSYPDAGGKKLKG